ncbi:MAG: topoisomerase IV [Clostridia bacterium]|nr:topoisomerase IV [Clostridia bacterium]
MAKKRDKKKESDLFGEMTRERFTEQSVSDTLIKNYMPYAMSVIVSRAIPEIDGFKPSQRKILYTMYKMGLLNGGMTKSANVVGATMKLNPHGNDAIYETIVRMTRGNESFTHPFIDSKGNMGKHYSKDSFAAARYTEITLSKLSRELFSEIDKDTVDFQDNYDGTMKEPILLPVTFPSILVNPNKGIAVAMSTQIPTFNLREIVEATCAFIDDNSCDLKQYIKAPDFSTGGILVYDEKIMDSIIENGKGSLKVRARYVYDKSSSSIEINEIPFTTTTDMILEEVAALVKDGKIKDINDIRDSTDKEGLKITVELKRNSDPDLVMSKLYRYTSLEDSFPSNINILINGQARVMGVRSVLGEWYVFRTTCVKRGLIFDISEKEERLHLLTGLEKILLDIDRAIAIIRNTEHDADVIPNLCDGFDIDYMQAEFIAEIKLRNINKEYILSKTAEKEKLEKDIERLTGILVSPKKINELIKSQLREIADKYGIDRKTSIIDASEVSEPSREETIEDYNLRVLLTRDGYFKKIPLTSLKTSPEQKLKDNDAVIKAQEWHNKSEIVFISDKQSVYKMRLYEMPESKAQSIGDYLANILDLSEGEHIKTFILRDDYKGIVIFGFENGRALKVPYDQFETKGYRRKLKNAYNGASPLANAVYLPKDGEIVFGTDGDKFARMDSSVIPLSSSRSGRGTAVIKLKPGQTVNLLCLPGDLGFPAKGIAAVRKIPTAGGPAKNSEPEAEES